VNLWSVSFCICMYLRFHGHGLFRYKERRQL